MKANFKFISTALCVCLLISPIMFSCEDESEPQVQNQPELSLDDAIEADTDFLAMKKAIDQNILLIQQSVNSNGVSSAEYKALYLSQDEARFDEIYSNSKAQISANIATAQKHYEALVAKFPSIKEQVSCTFKANMGVEDAKIALADFQDLSFGDATANRTYRCGWQYYTCIIAVGAPALACVIGSAPSGFLVAGLCVAGYGAGALLCLDSYCR